MYTNSFILSLKKKKNLSFQAIQQCHFVLAFSINVMYNLWLAWIKTFLSAWLNSKLLKVWDIIWNQPQLIKLKWSTRFGILCFKMQMRASSSRIYIYIYIYIVGIRAQNYILSLGPWPRTLVGLRTSKQ